jgi:hypothetical protein
MATARATAIAAPNVTAIAATTTATGQPFATGTRLSTSP